MFNKKAYNFLTGRTSIAMARRFHKNLKNSSIAISTEQWTIMFQLWEKEGLTQQEISSNTFKDKTSVTRLLNNLEQLNLVVRTPHHSDKRIKLIYLTRKGKDLQNECILAADKTIKEAFLGVSDDQLKICQDVLEKVFNNLK